MLNAFTSDSSSEPSSASLPPSEQSNYQEAHDDHPDQYDPFNPYSYPDPYAGHNGQSSEDDGQAVNIMHINSSCTSHGVSVACR